MGRGRRRSRVCRVGLSYEICRRILRALLWRMDGFYCSRKRMDGCHCSAGSTHVIPCDMEFVHSADVMNPHFMDSSGELSLKSSREHVRKGCCPLRSLR
jgi:hypothetical protein